MKFPYFHQIEATDCGPTCIQMISLYYKKYVDIESLKEACNVTRIGISLKDVLDGFRSIGFKAYAIKRDISGIDAIPLPAVLYWRQEHYVVLYDIKLKKGVKRYYIADPAYGVTIRTTTFSYKQNNTSDPQLDICRLMVFFDLAFY